MRRLAVLLAIAACASCKREPRHGTATYVKLYGGMGCAVLADKRVACWGAKPPAIADGMPVGETVKVETPPVLADGVAPGSYTQLVHGDAHQCALLRTGDVRCWGKNDFGQLGDGTRNPSDKAAVPVHGIEESTQIASGSFHTCALQKSGLVACWGKNDRHQLANGTTESSSRPVPVVGLVGVRQITAASTGTCALLGEGEVRCWGGNDDGSLGDARKPDHDVPVTVMLPR